MKSLRAFHPSQYWKASSASGGGLSPRHARPRIKSGAGSCAGIHAPGTKCPGARLETQTNSKTCPRAINFTAQSRESPGARRSEEHTSELQSQFHLVCRLLLEKKKK